MGGSKPMMRTKPSHSGMSTYTLTMGRDEWYQVKLLATLRRLSIRDLTRKLYQREIAAAKKAGEMR